MRRLPRTLPLFILLLASACRLEVRTPSGGGVAGDAAAVQEAVRGLYTGLATVDTAAVDSTALSAATVAVSGGGEGFVVPLMQVFWSATSGRTGERSLRVVRTEVQVTGDIALVRVALAARRAGAVTEGEANDHLTFVRREDGWRLAHAAFGPWRGRGAP